MKIDLDNHALNLTSASFQFSRMTGDVATITIGLDVPAGWTEAEPIIPDFPDGFEHLDYVEFWKHGAKLMAGYVSGTKPTPNGKAWDVEYTISSALAMLFEVPYVPPSTTERLVDSATAVAHVLAQAKAYSGLDFEYSLGSLSADKVVSITSATTCGEALQSLLDWCPNVRVAMSYTDTTDTILVGGTVPDCSYDLVSGELLGEDGAVLMSSEGAEAVELSPRYDLQHPCVTVLHGSDSASYGDSSKKYAPYSMVYDLPYSAVATEEDEDEPLGVNAVDSLKQKEIVKGYRLPLTAVFTSNSMTSRASAGVSGWAWWRGVGGVPPLHKITSEVDLIWGGFHVTPIAGADAYPTEEGEESTLPANYQDPTSWMYMYLHISGTFLADVDSADCTPGLNFSRVIIEQNVYLKKDTVLAGLTAEERDEWLCGTFSIDDEAAPDYIYTTLRLEGTVINRARKRYYPLTNELDAEDADYEEPEVEEEDDSTSSGSASWSDVQLGASQYYNATRNLYYDGSLALVKVEGSPSSLISSSLSVIGGLSEWVGMASPITRVSYNPTEHTLGITLGVSEIITINEYADRMATTRRLQLGAVASSLSASASADDGGSTTPDDGGSTTPDDEDNGVQSIAASYSVNYSVACTAKRRRPWEVYAEGDTWYIEGGQMYSPAGLITVPRQGITNYSKSKKYSVRLAYSEGAYFGRIVEL